jgi:hypothetical protein
MPHPEEYRNKSVVIPVAEGGTGSKTAATARTALGAAASGANGDITTLSALTSAIITGAGTLLRLASTVFQDVISALDVLSGGNKAGISFREATVETFTINYFGSVYGGGLDGQLWFTSLNNKPFNFSTGGVTVLNIASTGITVQGLIKHSNTTLLYTSVALANGAAAAAGTLGNAPVAGNPTKWVPINDNGVVRYIPAW